MRPLLISFCFLILVIESCAPPYRVNEEITLIGNLNTTCLEKNAWQEIANKYTTDSIKKPEFLSGLEEIQNHFLNLKYILYFPEGPEEIVGCNYYSARLAFNPELSNQSFSGMNHSISTKELTRIRNRIQKLLKEYQCKDGQMEADELMQESARD